MPEPRDISVHAHAVGKKPPGAVKVSASVTITLYLSHEISACMHMLCVRSRRGRLKSPLRCEDTPTRVNFTRPPARQAIALTGSESARRASVRGCRCPETRRCWQVKAGCRKRSQHRVNAGLEGRSERPTGRGIGNPGAWRTIPREAALLASKGRPGVPE